MWAKFHPLPTLRPRPLLAQRAVPSPRPDRRSKLEFVSSMAELQQRARAYDLAVENVYQRTRRALARYAGLPATATPAQLAERVAAIFCDNLRRWAAEPTDEDPA